MGNELTKEQLLEIEKGFWLEGSAYYNKHITNEAIFVFPDMVLAKEDGVAATDQAPRWDKVEMTNTQLLNLSKNVAVLTYHATAKREDKKPYEGNITTIYQIENGQPKMAFHQQTPDSL